MAGRVEQVDDVVAVTIICITGPRCHAASRSPSSRCGVARCLAALDGRQSGSRPRTAAAFSVSVVLPASGWKMMAKVRQSPRLSLLVAWSLASGAASRPPRRSRFQRRAAQAQGDQQGVPCRAALQQRAASPSCVACRTASGSARRRLSRRPSTAPVAGAMCNPRRRGRRRNTGAQHGRGSPRRSWCARRGRSTGHTPGSVPVAPAARPPGGRLGVQAGRVHGSGRAVVASSSRASLRHGVCTTVSPRVRVQRSSHARGPAACSERLPRADRRPVAGGRRAGPQCATRGAAVEDFPGFMDIRPLKIQAQVPDRTAIRPRSASASPRQGRACVAFVAPAKCQRHRPTVVPVRPGRCPVQAQTVDDGGPVGAQRTAAQGRASGARRPGSSRRARGVARRAPPSPVWLET